MNRRVVALAVFAFFIRLAYLHLHPIPVPLTGDAMEYHTYAVSLLEHGRYEGPNGDLASRMPGYPLFLALCGGSVGIAAFVQCLLGAGVCVLLYLAAARLTDPPWPLACAASAAVYFNLISSSAYILSECLYGFFLAAFAAAALAKKPLLSGLLASGAFLVRPESLPWALLTLAALQGFKPRQAAQALAVLALIGGVWTARNFMVFHKFIPISSVGSYNVYLGLRLPLGPVPQPPTPLPELQRDLFYRGLFHEYFHSLPWKTIIKAYAFDLGSLFYPFLPGYDFTYVILIPFWLFGFWLARKDRRLWPFCAMVLLSAATYTFVGGPVSRYRRGFSPFLLLLAAVGMQSLQRRLGAKRFYWGMGAWSALNLAVFACADAFRQGALWVKSGLLGP